LDAISIDDYLKFLIYSLEYRAIVMEQMSHEREVRENNNETMMMLLIMILIIM